MNSIPQTPKFSAQDSIPPTPSTPYPDRGTNFFFEDDFAVDKSLLLPRLEFSNRSFQGKIHLLPRRTSNYYGKQYQSRVSSVRVDEFRYETKGKYP